MYMTLVSRRLASLFVSVASLPSCHRFDRACEFYRAYGAKALALGTSGAALEKHTQCLALWKL